MSAHPMWMIGAAGRLDGSSIHPVVSQFGIDKVSSNVIKSKQNSLNMGTELRHQHKHLD